MLLQQGVDGQAPMTPTKKYECRGVSVENGVTINEGRDFGRAKNNDC